MPPAVRPLWLDPDLITCVDTAREQMFRVFRLNENSPYASWNDVKNRIEDNGLTKKETDAAAKCLADFHEDVVEKHILPRSIGQLDGRLDTDYGASLRTLAVGALSGGTSDTYQIDFVVSSVHSQLVWTLVQHSQELKDLANQGQSWEPKLVAWAAPLITRTAIPTPVFGNYALLQNVAVEWPLFLNQLGLDEDTRNRTLTRDKIEERRTRPGSDGTSTVLIPWPPAISQLMTTLMNPEKTPDLHWTIHKFVASNIQKQQASSFKPNKPWHEVKADAISEFLEMVLMKTIKNAANWDNTKIPGSTTWAPRVFNNLAEDAQKAVNYALGLGANPPKKDSGESQGDKRPSISFDSALLGVLRPRKSGEGISLETLYEKINELPEHQRKFLLLKFPVGVSLDNSFKALSNKKIADLLGLSTEWVTKEINLALDTVVEKVPQK